MRTQGKGCLWLLSHRTGIALRGSVASCPQGVEATGSRLVGMDRAGHAHGRARACDAQGVGWRGMRDAQAPHGLESFAATVAETRQDGTQGYGGPGNLPRAEAPRPVGIAEPVEGKTLGDWGTPRVTAPVEPTAWPQGSRERSERQAHRFQRMRDHGALHTNSGRQKMRGAASATRRRPPRPRAGGGPEARGVAGAGGQDATRPRWSSPRPQGMAHAWSNVRGPWQCWKRRTKTRHTNTTDWLRQRRPGAPRGRGRIALSARKRS